MIYLIEMMGGIVKAAVCYYLLLISIIWNSLYKYNIHCMCNKCIFFHTGGALASAPLPCGVSYHDPADAVAMVSRESAVPVDREGKRSRHHCR